MSYHYRFHISSDLYRNIYKYNTRKYRAHTHTKLQKFTSLSHRLPDNVLRVHSALHAISIANCDYLQIANFVEHVYIRKVINKSAKIYLKN